MPPKRKRPAQTEDKETEMVLEYLQRTNRPFSAGDISSNLHNAVSKASVQKILQQLTENGQVVCKTYGKQSIYVIKQESDQIPSKEELQRIDEDITGLKQEVDALSSEVKQLSSVLNGLTASMTTEQVKEKLERIREENKQYASKLEVLRAGTVMVDADEKKRVEEDYERYRQAWKSRKRMFNQIFEAITEHHPSKPKELLEEIGIETDEDAGLQFDQTTV